MLDKPFEAFSYTLRLNFETADVILLLLLSEPAVLRSIRKIYFRPCDPLYDTSEGEC